MIEVGEKAPEFELPNQNGDLVQLSSLQGQWVVVYFYPKDDTPGCTKEACEFTENISAFTEMNATILGVSPDSPASHTKFIEKYDLEVTLLSDEELKIMPDYHAYGIKKLYGKEVEGVIRSTVIIDPDGVIAHRWKTVRASGHAARVREVIEKLQLKAA